MKQKPSFAEKTRFPFTFCTFFLYDPTLKVDNLLYHDLLDCDPTPQTNSSRYLWQITLLRELMKHSKLVGAVSNPPDKSG